MIKKAKINYTVRHQMEVTDAYKKLKSYNKGHDFVTLHEEYGVHANYHYLLKIFNYNVPVLDIKNNTCGDVVMNGTELWNWLVTAITRETIENNKKDRVKLSLNFKNKSDYLLFKLKYGGPE